MELTLKFVLEKETPGTVRYKEVTEDGEMPKLKNFYLSKSVINGSAPQSFEMTLKGK